jgi:hypothetical protein
MRRLALFSLGLTLACLGAISVAADEQPVRPAVVRQPVRAGTVKSGAPKGGQPKAAPQTLSDEEALKQAKLSPTDGEKLLDYLRQRTLSDADQGRINEIIAKFGADDFDERVEATEYVQSFGPAAIGPLKKLLNQRDGDPEVMFRARIALKKLEKIPHSAVAAAAARAVAKLKPPGAAAVLIAFLPLADSEALADTIREALTALAVVDGKAEPALVSALSDKSPVRRAAAYLALTEGGPPAEHIRVKDAYPRLREAVLKETDPETKFGGLWSLALVTREKEYVPALIEMIPKLGRGRIWQLEELLLLMAGNHPKDGRFLKSAESLAKARDAWLGWWKEKGPGFDFAKFQYKPRVQGITDIIEMDGSGYGQGRIVSLGPDLKEKWRLVGLNFPTDLKVAPNGHIWVAETNSNRVTERDTAGNTITTRNITVNNGIQQPINLDLLPDGGMVVICRAGVVQLDKDGKQAWAFPRPNYDIMAGRRLPNGETLYLTNQFQNPNAAPIPNGFRIDEKGKDTGHNLQFKWVQQLQSIGATENSVLVCERDTSVQNRQVERVAEYDLKTGKQTWKYDCPANSAPQCCQRLPNGNTLICLLNHNQLIEVDPSGEIVWDYQARDGLKVGRAYRR